MKTSHRKRTGHLARGGCRAACAAILAGLLPSTARATSPIYDYTVIARPGLTSDRGDTVAGIKSEVSVNEQGEVAFIVTTADSSYLGVGSKPGQVRNISLTPSGVNMDFPQINNQGRVVTRELRSGNSVVRLWNARNPGDFLNIATTFASPFSQVTLPVLGNTAAGGPPAVFFIGRDSDLPFALYVNETGERDLQDQVSGLTGETLDSFRSAAADTAQRTIVAQFSSPGDVGRVLAFTDTENNGLWTAHEIAGPGTNWTRFGSTPGISDSGRIIGFIGQRQGREPALYLATPNSSEPSGYAVLWVFAVGDTIAYDANDKPITLASIEVNQRVGVLHQERGPDGLDGDIVILTFVGTPAKASRNNPATGAPLLFSGQKGIWALRCDLERDLPAPRALHLNVNAPVAVAQVGDRFDGLTVTDLALYDPLATPLADLNGGVRTPGPADHYVAFSAQTSSGALVIRAARLDTDGDGLMDHWETRGIDLENDGVVELNLPALGANRDRKDIFLELDWTAPMQSGGAGPFWYNAPPPGAIENAVAMFANAPVTNADGSTGITLHIDGGPGLDAEGLPYSRTMGRNPALLGGGDLIGMPGQPQVRPDAIYMGTQTNRVPGTNLRSLQGVKEEFFANRDRGAREFAFKYGVLADFQDLATGEKREHPAFVSQVASATSNTLVSATPIPTWCDGLVKITAGKGAGQVNTLLGFTAENQTSSCWVKEPWTEVPDTSSTFTIFNGSSGLAEMLYRNYYRTPTNTHTMAGGEFLVTLRTWGANRAGWVGEGGNCWRTIVHEMGHTLGLMHGGIDMSNYKTNPLAYYSIMNYAYQMEADGPGYSGYFDDVFNDWTYLRMNSAENNWTLGTSSGAQPAWGAGAESLNQPDMTVEEYEAIIGGPVDLEPPQVAVLAPAAGVTVGPGGSVSVTVSAQDALGISRVRIYLDIDGDGQWTGPGEVAEAAAGAPPFYTAQFNGLTGPFGARRLFAIAMDSRGNRSVGEIGLFAGSGAGGGVELHNAGGVFNAQAPGGARQVARIGPLNVAGSGRLSFTVTATPPARQAGATTPQFDSMVTGVVFESVNFPLAAAASPAGASPSVCSSYWNSPSNGQLYVDILGPALYDANRVFQGSPAQNYNLVVTFLAVDTTPPRVVFEHPVPGDFAETGGVFTAIVQVTDDYGMGTVSATLDADGNGVTTDPGEQIAATDLSGGRWQAVFNITGPAGARPVRIAATDAAGNTRTANAGLDVRLPDLTPPALAIASPPPGWPVRAGENFTVGVNASDNVELQSITAFFDRDGNGDFAGTGETLTLPRTSANYYSGGFSNIGGASGPRDVTVIATDTALHSTTSSVPVTVGGVVLVPQLIYHTTGQIVNLGYRQEITNFPALNIPLSGRVEFIVNAVPSLRRTRPHQSGQDPYLRVARFDGTNYDTAVTWSVSGIDPSISTASYFALRSGPLEMTMRGPGSWDIWGGWNGHETQDYVLDVYLTPIDITRPTVDVTAPTLGTDLPPGAPFTVDVNVTDDTVIASVVVAFDHNGDGDTSDLQETVSASPLGGSVYRANFPAVSGIPGRRIIRILATDTSFNSTEKLWPMGVGGVGTGEQRLVNQTGTLPAQGWVYNGGQRQIVPVGPISIPGQGRLTFRVVSTPSNRKQGTNLSRHDPRVEKITFDGVNTTLSPVCNNWDADPAICVSVWDTPGAGTMNFEILGGATYNYWGEFDGSLQQNYSLEVLFQPGPTVTQVNPNAGVSAGHDAVTILGNGFSTKAVVLFNDVPGTDMQWISAGELRCKTPPGLPGAAEVVVLNDDPDNQPWNYGRPYGLFGRLPGGFTYQSPPGDLIRNGERFLGVWTGYFPSVGNDGAQQSTDLPFAIPGPGKLRFEAYAFVPVLGAIPGPFGRPEDLHWYNESTTVRSLTGLAGGYSLSVTSTELNAPYAPVISTSVFNLPNSTAGSGTFRLVGPAIWKAFDHDLGWNAMSSAPAQNWAIGAWFTDQIGLASVKASSGSELGGTPIRLGGSNFKSGMVVRIGGWPAEDVVVVNDSFINCTTPPGPRGPADVEVDLFGMKAALPGGFTYLAEPGVDEVTEFRFADTPGGQSSTQIGTAPGRRYQLQRSTNLLNPAGWTDVGLPVAGDGSVKTLADPLPPTGEENVFYRVIIAR